MQEAGNTIGNIPVKWYDKYDHIGYDLNGEKIMRPKSLDAIDKYIQSHDKNERWVAWSAFELDGRSTTRRRERRFICRRARSPLSATSRITTTRSRATTTRRSTFPTSRAR